ncbi:MAG TPA: hypothetical protein VMT29_16535 [Steroidobacteraceae bacterium]|nr:hypothetical protein [Steroidobacteraceae bacterium]
MSRKNNLARSLIILGAIVLFLSAAMHCFAGYPRVAAAVSESNLSPVLKVAVRTTFLLAGWNWLAVGVIALLAAVRVIPGGRLLILLLGASVAVETALSLSMMGPFIGDELLGAAAALLLAGGFLTRSPPG